MIKPLCWLSAIALLAWSPDADACSCAPDPLIILPKPGSTNIPTNVQFLFGPTQGFSVSLLRAAAVIETFEPGASVQRFIPAMPLEPDTDYLLTGHEAVSFRTGAGPDTTPPSLEDFTFTSYGSPPITLRGGSSCGTVEWIAFDPKGITDPHLHFEFFSGPTPETVDLTSSRTLPPVPLLHEGVCGPNNFPLKATSRLAGALVAIDFAGNRSTLTPIHILKGGGCSSTTGLMPLAALCLLALRRRYRATSGQ